MNVKMRWLKDMKVGDRLDVYHTYPSGEQQCYIHTLIEKNDKKNCIKTQGMKYGNIKEFAMDGDEIFPLHTYTVNATKLLSPTSNSEISNVVNYHSSFVMLNDSCIEFYNVDANCYWKQHQIDIGQYHTARNIISCDDNNNTLWIFDTHNLKLTLFNFDTRKLKYFALNQNIKNESIANDIWSTSSTLFKQSMSSLSNALSAFIGGSAIQNDIIADHYDYWKYFESLNDLIDIHFEANNKLSVLQRDGKFKTFFVSAPFHQFHIIQITYGTQKQLTFMNHAVFYILYNQWKQYQFTISGCGYLAVGNIVYVEKLQHFLMFIGWMNVHAWKCEVHRNPNHTSKYEWICLDGMLQPKQICFGGNTIPMLYNVVGFDYIIFSLSGSDGIWCYDSLISNKWYKCIKTIDWVYWYATSLVRNGIDVHLIKCNQGYGALYNDVPAESRHLKFSLDELLPFDLIKVYFNYYQMFIIGYFKQCTGFNENTMYRKVVKLIFKYILSCKQYQVKRRKKKKRKFKYCDCCMIKKSYYFPLKLCSRCIAVYYCSRRCQKIQWKKKHRLHCV
eukprot:274406_1